MATSYRIIHPNTPPRFITRGAFKSFLRMAAVRANGIRYRVTTRYRAPSGRVCGAVKTLHVLN